ncbi:MAG TPA: hypothetical protein VM367_16900 [Pseudonocardia sp.]|jgi:hypothetical protein|nr:hypothetical protein [Pseudonocardia sp.]
MPSVDVLDETFVAVPPAVPARRPRLWPDLRLEDRLEAGRAPGEDPA